MRIMIAIPCMDMMHSDFVISLTGLRHEGNVRYVYSVSSLVYDSRNGLARRAIVEGFDRVLWLDSDMKFSADLLERLNADLDEDRDLVSGLYVTRKPPFKPCIFKECGYKHKDGDREVRPYADSYYDYPKDSIFEIDACGFGGVLMKTSLLKAVESKYGLPFAPMLGFGEDISFCLRAKDLGAKMYCDSRINLGHVGFYTYTEDNYLEIAKNGKL